MEMTCSEYYEQLRKGWYDLEEISSNRFLNVLYHEEVDGVVRFKIVYLYRCMAERYLTVKNCTHTKRKGLKH